MSAPTLYLIIIENGRVAGISSHREIGDLAGTWKNRGRSTATGMIHCGLMRPQFDDENLSFSTRFEGRVLYTGSLKWSLPDLFGISDDLAFTAKINSQPVPCYLALNHWGYECTPDVSSQEDQVGLRIATSSGLTFSQAVQTVLEQANIPLTAEEIFSTILENGYYAFGLTKPFSVFEEELGRICGGDTTQPNIVNNPLVRRVSDRLYCLFDSRHPASGWLGALYELDEVLFQGIVHQGIFTEQEYIAQRRELPQHLRDRADATRFGLLQSSIDSTNPLELLSITPLRILDAPVKQIGFTARINNVLTRYGINTMSELAALTPQKLWEMRGFGKGSFIDMTEAIGIAIFQKEDLAIGPEAEEPDDTVSLLKTEAETESTDPGSLIERTLRTSLVGHLQQTLTALRETERFVLHARMGYAGPTQTLEEVAAKLGIARKRVRQIQKKYVKKIIDTEYWDDVIGIRVGQLLNSRTEPLILEMIDFEDPWFAGFNGNYTYLGNVIQMFSENAIQVINANHSNVVTRITQSQWDSLLQQLRQNIRHKAEERRWSRRDIRQLYESSLTNFSSDELAPILESCFEEYLEFENSEQDAILLAFGGSAELAIAAVLREAEAPLHYKEIANRASRKLGREVASGRVQGLLYRLTYTTHLCVASKRTQGAAANQRTWLFDRVVFGLIGHCPLQLSVRQEIRSQVEDMLFEGEINKQWHSTEIIKQLRQQYPSTPASLDPYVLRMCIEESDRIVFLRRMVWARADSGLQT